MRPYGERKKRRPGGREHWIFSLLRRKSWKQVDRYEPCAPADSKKMKTWARRQGKKDCEEP